MRQTLKALGHPDLTTMELFAAGVNIAHPTIMEIMGRAGFDFVLIDAEHSPIDRGDIQSLIRAADCVGTQAMVRVPGVDAQIWVETALDAGAAAVLIPRIETAQQVSHAVACCRYPPQGRRGSGPGRAAQHGVGIATDIRDANERVAVCIMLETFEALDNIDEITRTPGLDLVLIGPNDLALALSGVPDAISLEEAIARIAEACKRNGVTFGIFVLDLGDLSMRREQGMRVFIGASDLFLLIVGARAALETARPSR